MQRLFTSSRGLCCSFLACVVMVMQFWSFACTHGFVTASGDQGCLQAVQT